MKTRYLQIIDSIYKISNYRDLYSQNQRHYGSDEVYYEVELHILEEIIKKNDITMLELVAIFYKTKSYISQVVSALVKKGLIEKGKSPEDSRKNIYTVTQKGLNLHAVHAQYDEKQAARLKDILCRYKDEDIEMILEFLEKYHCFQLENKEAVTDRPLYKSSHDRSMTTTC